MFLVALKYSARGSLHMKIESYESIKKYCKDKGYCTFTDLQESVFRLPDFWNLKQDFFIISETSSGKTLIAEAAMLMDKNNKKQRVLYLVPYRALASQKMAELKYFFGNTFKIVLSTGEYRENDSAIINGETDIAIMIYEKAFLFENLYENFLASYDLLILDEFGIVDSEERGIKADIILTWSKQVNDMRTIVLTTPNFDWGCYATEDRFSVVECKKRPTELSEVFLIRKKVFSIVDDKKKFHWEISRIENGNCDIAFENSNATLENVIISVCQYHWVKRQKILVFVNNREEVKRKAEQIYEKLVEVGFCNKPTLEQTMAYKEQLLNNMNLVEDDLYSIFQDENYAMMYCGITFHSAAMPAELRREIEKGLLNDDGGLNIVVATETLAYGLNSNVDAVLIADIFKPNNENNGKKILSQNEYFNYIGRAGRFMKNSGGYTYTILPERVYNEWLDVYTSPKEKIESNLYSLDEKKAAIYLLSIFPRDRSSIDIQKIEKFVSEIPHHRENIQFSVEKAVNLLEKAGLVKTADDAFQTEYYITDRGTKVKGYIVSIDTFWKLDQIVQDILSDSKFYLFDYLYRLSACNELLDESSQQFSGNKGAYMEKVLRNFEWLKTKALDQGHLSYELERSIMGNTILSKIHMGKRLSFEEQKVIVQLREAMILYMRIFDYRISDIYNMCLVSYGSIQALAEIASFLLDTLTAIGYKRLSSNEKLRKLKNISTGLYMGVCPEVFEVLEESNVDVSNRAILRKIAECIRLIREINNMKNDSWRVLKIYTLKDKINTLELRYQINIKERLGYIDD